MNSLAINLSFSMERFLQSLSIMGMGMLGIFIVTGAIILLVMLLNRLTNHHSQNH